MTAVESSTVIGDRIAVVGTVGDAVGVAGQVEACQWERDSGAKLISASFGRREPLEVDDKDLGKTIQCIALCAFSSCLALFACRHLIAIKSFFFCE